MNEPTTADPDDAWRRRVEDVAELLAWVTSRRPATLAGGRLVCVDGRAGSGKSTLGAALEEAAGVYGTARLLHMDDLYDGWSGLDEELPGRVGRHLIAPLSQGRPGRYRRYDWAAARYAEWHTVHPVDTLVLEGVGSGAVTYHDAITTLVWVQAPRELRIRRGIARDGEAVLPHWLAWMEDEDAWFARHRTRERAHVLVDGTGESDRAVVLG